MLFWEIFNPIWHARWTYWPQILSKLCFQWLSSSGNYEIMAISTDKITFLLNLIIKLTSGNNFIKFKKEKADKISSEIIPNMLAEQGLSSLKLADGSSVDVRKSYNCTIKKDQMELAYNWLRENGLGDIIKNEVAVQFGKGEDNKAEQLLSLAEQEGYEVYNVRVSLTSLDDNWELALIGRNIFDEA